MTLFIVLVLTLVLKGHVAQTKAGSGEKSRVLVLGAGISGITAARTLQQNNITDFVILEAQDYIGGRLKAVAWQGLNVEAGANWIHSIHDNASRPLWLLKTQVNMQGKISNYTDITIRNKDHCLVADNDMIHKFRSTLQQLDLQSGTKTDICRDSFRRHLQHHGWTNTSSLQNIIEYFHIDFECARDPDTVSYYKLDTQKNDFFVSDPRGISFMYKPMYQTFVGQIRLGETVKSIDYTNNSVQVTTSSGMTFTADYVICTFSSGIILSDLVTFKPPLPTWKTDAYAKMPLSLYTKIFVKFPVQFWDNSEYILHDSHRRGYYPVMQNFAVYTLEARGVLLVTVTGSEASRVENQSDNETLQEVMTVLRGLYSQDIPEPLGLFYERWSQNPFTRGAYSEAVLGTTSWDFTAMKQHTGRLYFAGEATSEEWYGYMQGAYHSGNQVAMEIVKTINKR